MMSKPAKSLLLAKPFLKWAGGKTQLIEQMSHYLPKQLKNGLIKTYVEPFIGGGAFFFYLASNYSIERFIISDVNLELIIAYKTIQKDVDALIGLLSEMESKYLWLSESERKNLFYQTRQDFNLQRTTIDFYNYNQDWISRTAQIIFLNKTCFNGLFRVNARGGFNVPMGKYAKPNICNPDNLQQVAEILQITEIIPGDFTNCEELIDSNTFVYFDPPYRPISKTSNFTAYSDQTFDDGEQLRLCEFFKFLDKQQALLMLSNSDPKNYDANDDFFEQAYAGYRIERVKASRNINSNALKRNQINELLITNY